jgi:hypothetical protein
MTRKVKVWDILNPNVPRTEENLQKARIEICETCERFFKPTRQCRECGCFMDMKTKLEEAYCPIGKW